MLTIRQRNAALAVCVLIWTAAPAGLAQTNSARFQPLKAEHLIGMTVEDPDGQEMGKIYDFVVNLQTGQLQYVVIASGGWMGIRARLRAVPPAVLSAGTTKRDTLAIRVYKSRWAAAPACRLSDLAALASPERTAQIEQFYGRPQTEVQIADGAGERGPAATGSPTGHRSANAALKLATDIFGRRVVNREHERIGEVLDLLIEFNAREPAFALVSAGKFFKDRDRRYAVSLRALTPDNDTGHWALDANRALLEQAPPFDPRARPANTTVYRYQDPGHAALTAYDPPGAG